MKKAARYHGTSDKGKGKQILISTIFGICVGIACMLGFLMIFSAICMMIPNPHPFIAPLCLFSVYASAFFSGFAGVKRNGGKEALICGALCGAAYMIILWLSFAIIQGLFGERSTNTASLIIKLCILPSAILGAFSGLKTRNNNRRKIGKKT